MLKLLKRWLRKRYEFKSEELQPNQAVISFALAELVTPVCLSSVLLDMEVVSAGN